VEERKANLARKDEFSSEREKSEKRTKAGARAKKRERRRVCACSSIVEKMFCGGKHTLICPTLAD
jgi:CDGSH-type Zn-finger protein